MYVCSKSAFWRWSLLSRNHFEVKKTRPKIDSIDFAADLPVGLPIEAPGGGRKARMTLPQQIPLATFTKHRDTKGQKPRRTIVSPCPCILCSRRKKSVLSEVPVSVPTTKSHGSTGEKLRDLALGPLSVGGLPGGEVTNRHPG